MKFRAWSYQLTINANLLNFSTTQQKRKLLTELLSNRAAAEKPFSVTASAFNADKWAYGIRQRPRSGLAGRPRAVGDGKYEDIRKVIFIASEKLSPHGNLQIDEIKEHSHDLKAKDQVIYSKSFP